LIKLKVEITKMSMLSILLVHLGEGPLPSHMRDAYYNLSRLNSLSRIILIANECNRQHFIDISAPLASQFPRVLEFVAVETITPSQTTTEFRRTTKLNKKFRSGFWFHASNRFYVIADYMTATSLDNCLHIETDVVLYFDPAEKLTQFQEYADFSVPLDRKRAIPGVVWLKNSLVAKRLTEHMLLHKDQDDMATLGEFCLKNPSIARPLPSIPVEYAIQHDLDQKRYCQGLDLFGGIFDCAAIGQYVGGIHWLNDPENTRFFLNESSDLNMSQFDFTWRSSVIGRVPQIGLGITKTKILSLHAHSKDLLGVSPANTSLQIERSEIISGERIQALADLTISTKEINKFHSKAEIEPKEILNIPVISRRISILKTRSEHTAPDEIFLAKCNEKNKIFVYTHLIPYFKKYIAPRLNSNFILITHNSDNAVSLDDLDLLNHPKLITWYAQNAEVSHSKLQAIPIGVANQQWGSEKIDQLLKAAQAVEKTGLVYANFSASTHPSRLEARNALNEIAGITIEQNVTFNQYAKQLASHKFCICPRGNGIDTHRFWEAQYLDCIPIILRQDWTEAYSGLPVVLLDNWTHLNLNELERLYIQISTTAFDRRTLSLSHFAGTFS
jgi:hypothetical protein